MVLLRIDFWNCICDGTSYLILKSTIDTLFAKHGSSMKYLRGQGNDGAINMHNAFNGLKDLILKIITQHIISIVLVNNFR